MRLPPLPVLLLAPLPALSQPLAETHFARNFCWARSYDADHLAAHPEQRVAFIELSREPAGTPSAPGETMVEVRVRIRGEGEELASVATCRTDGEGLACVMEGDGGGFALSAEGSRAVRLSVGERGMTFEGEDGFHELEADEGDDRAFVLGRCG